MKVQIHGLSNGGLHNAGAPKAPFGLLSNCSKEIYVLCSAAFEFPFLWVASLGSFAPAGHGTPA